MQSCIYEGHVRHRRFGPVARTFEYPLFLVYVDLAELEPVFGRRGIWSTRFPAIARFCRADHLEPRTESLDEAVRALVATRLGWRPAGPIRLLTHFRYFGIAMNPVSFYFCFDPAGTCVEAVVAEVNNTPWNEQHCYVLDFRAAGSGKRLRARHTKDFHVSPFLPMELDYRWHIAPPGERMAIGIECLDDRGKVFQATLALRRSAMTKWRLATLLARYPIMTLQVLVAIYWQAFLIWWRGIPFVPHPRATRQADRARPRTSSRSRGTPQHESQDILA